MVTPAGAALSLSERARGLRRPAAADYFLPAGALGDCEALYADTGFGLSLSAFGFFFSFGTRI
jgi:hypothetical protein